MFFKSMFIAAMMFVAACSTGCATLESCYALGNAIGGAVGMASSYSKNPRVSYRSYEMSRNARRAGEGACAVAVEQRRAKQPAILSGGGSGASTAEIVAEAKYRENYERTMAYEAGRQGHEDAQRDFGRPRRNYGW